MDHYTIKLAPGGGRGSEILKNGEPLPGVVSVRVSGGVGQMTTLSLDVYGSVDIEMDADAVEVTEINDSERRYIKFPIDAA